MIAKLQLSCHNLGFETNRHTGDDNSNRKKLCTSNDVAYEFPFIAICPFCQELDFHYVHNNYMEDPGSATTK